MLFNALIARKLIIRMYLYSFTNNELEIFSTTLSKASCSIEISSSLLVNWSLLQVNPNNSLTECINLLLKQSVVMVTHVK